MILDQLETERSNPDTWNIDRLSTHDLLAVMQREDEKVAGAVKQALPEIAMAVDEIAQSLRDGRASVLCRGGNQRPFGCAGCGGMPANLWYFAGSCTGVDCRRQGEPCSRLSKARRTTTPRELPTCEAVAWLESDVVVGLAASGRTPYVIGALRHGRITRLLYGCRNLLQRC